MGGNSEGQANNYGAGTMDGYGVGWMGGYGGVWVTILLVFLAARLVAWMAKEKRK
jgi:hypothetical protein